MRLTLYWAYKPTASYKTVLHPNIRSQYLTSLQYKMYEIPDTYMSYNGEINIAYNINDFPNINKINYMTVYDNEVTSTTKYYFIDDIQLYNGILNIKYSLDVWNSYSDYFEINKAHIVRCSTNLIAGNTTQNLSLPTPVLTNYSFEIMDQDKFNEGYLIAQCQRYKLTTSGSSTNREVFTALIGKMGVVELPTTLSIIENWCVALRNVQSAAINDYYYEFDNFTFVPSQFINSASISNFKDVDINIPLRLSTWNYMIVSVLSYNPLNGDEHEPIIYEGYNYTVYAEYQIVGVCVGGAILPYEYDGNEKMVAVSIYIDVLDFKLLVKWQGSIIDITDYFIIDVPFNSINGETQAQRQIARELEQKNAVQSFIGMSTKIASSATSFIKGRPAQGINSAGGAINDLVEGAFLADVQGRDKVQSTYSAFIKGQNTYGLSFGVGMLYVNAENINEIESLIKHVGFGVDFMATTPWRNYSTEYELTIQVDFAEVYNVPTNIGRQIENILKNGTRIVRRKESV